MPNTTFFNDMKDNQYNPADKDKLFNASVTFCDTAHEVTRDEREAQFAARQAMIEQTKKDIQNEK